MNDPFEKKIRDHLDEFDQMEALDKDLMWSHFERKRQLGKTNKIHFKLNNGWFAVAASITALLACLIIFQNQNKVHKNLIVNNLEHLDEGLVEYQASLVSSMDSYASTIKSLDVRFEEFPEISESLDQVERLAKSYQIDLKQYGPDPKIIKAILKCAKQKVELYEMLLYQIEIKKYHEKKNEKFKV